MLSNEIIDAAQELAEVNARWTPMHDIDIVHRVSQVVHEHLTVSDKFGKLAIGAYRFHESKSWENYNEVEETIARILA